MAQTSVGQTPVSLEAPESSRPPGHGLDGPVHDSGLGAISGELHIHLTPF